MADQPHIWIADDEADVRYIFAQALMQVGYAVSQFKHGVEVVNQLRKTTPALVVLDVKMPQLDGWETLRGLRNHGFSGPVLMITSENDVGSRIKGLDGGADDYLGKPCVPAELVARVRALLRRSPQQAQDRPALQLGDVTVDFQRRTATKAGQPLRLTRTDFAVLAVLHANAGSVVSRDMILERAWQDQSGNSHALDTHIWRLRRKLGDDSKEPRWIKSVPAMGYILTP